MPLPAEYLSVLRKYRIYFIPVVLYVFALLLSHCIWDFTLNIPWGYFQLLDQQALENAPVHTLYLMHSQPPLLNTLLAVLIKVSAFFHTSPEALAQGLFMLLGLGSTVFLFHILLNLTGSWEWAMGGVVITLTDPAYHVYQNQFFYPFILHFLLIFLLFISLTMLKRGQQGIWLLLAALCFGLITNTRSLFHPLWAILSYGLLLTLFFIMHRTKLTLRWKNIAWITVFLGFLLFLWPFKNYLLFDQFSYSSWSGVNLARDTPIRSPALQAFLSTGRVPPVVTADLQAFQRKHNLEDISVLSSPQKSNGQRNWNHYIFTRIGGAMGKAAVRYRLEHPGEWLRTAAGHYVKWGRCSYVNPYSGKIRGPNNPKYRRYARFYYDLVYFSVRPVFERLFPGINRRKEFFMRGQPVPFTFFGFLIFPVVLVLSVVVGVRRFRDRRFEDFAAVILPLFTVLWLLVVPCLTDGTEGNRMRFSGTPYLTVLALIGLRKVSAVVSERRQRKRAA